MIEIKVGPTESVALDRHPPPAPDTWELITPGSGDSRIHAVLSQRALLDIHCHADPSRDEVGGVLIGEVYEWSGDLYVEIQSVIAAPQAPSGPAHVTFTAEDWAMIERERVLRYPECKMVGWYHSHPGHGIFLSGMDLDIHRDFFPCAWHLALVIDGQDRTFGLFNWDCGTIAATATLYLTHARNGPALVRIDAAVHPLSYRVCG